MGPCKLDQPSQRVVCTGLAPAALMHPSVPACPLTHGSPFAHPLTLPTCSTPLQGGQGAGGCNHSGANRGDVPCAGACNLGCTLSAIASCTERDVGGSGLPTWVLQRPLQAVPPTAAVQLLHPTQTRKIETAGQRLAARQRTLPAGGTAPTAGEGAAGRAAAGEGGGSAGNSDAESDGGEEEDAPSDDD